MLESARGDDHPVDAGGVDELTGGADADLAEPGDQDRLHFGPAGLTGSRGPAARAIHRRWSGGTGPLLRTFTTTDTAAAMAATSNPRWKAFMRRRV